ncbi:hypothetical protein [Sulfobacillus harzensis]|uniref:Uncharacterized protein n=1 Tax=Sulfobacillus harzensis TaxID=2729629 RepID=A0A7Y0L6B0_9FIRM|nr:hypothetical protein [Sulfobacillus harzensis]NMP24036.1 hypothetical protein [Sulfobacillus harzensis]
MLIQCPTCQHTHKTTGARKRWHCTECGTLWDATGRVVTGRKFPKPRPSPETQAKARAARKQKAHTRPTEDPPGRKKTFWDAEIL